MNFANRWALYMDRQHRSEG